MPFLPLAGVSNACALIVAHLLATTPEHRTILVKRTLFFISNDVMRDMG